ncbi:MAG TPA: hypothetical protein VIQ27_17855 [Gemmatimonadales bacterium]|jgi:hypothetical protein
MRHLLSYLLFVGIPLAGLLGVLRVGQGLEAPRAVHGSWAVQPMAASGRVCTRYLLSDADSTLVISQSGRELTGTLGPGAEVGLKGALRGDQIALEGVIQPGATPRHVACTAGDTLRLTAKVFATRDARQIQGRLWFPSCADCGAVGFTAARPREYHVRRRA